MTDGSNDSRTPTATGEDVEITVCPRGPLLVRGASFVIRDGHQHEVGRPVVAVCACGKTSNDPWCDGTHKLIPRKQTPSARPT
jgi:CDGSH-type Zn-finger protein